MLLDRPRVEQSGQAPATFDGDDIDDDGRVGYGDGVFGHDKIDDDDDDIDDEGGGEQGRQDLCRAATSSKE